ncbi:MAG: type II secretion system inner membrane protein GspF [Arenicella sp.]
MAAFEYQALDASGKTIKGIANGDHVRHVRQQLRDQGLTPMSVAHIADQAVNDSGSSKGKVSSSGSSKARRTKIKTNDLAVLTRQMATLLGSGLTIEETLNAMVKQAEGHKLQTVLGDVRALVTEGYSLSDAIALYPKSFPGIYCASISAGEQSGNLDDVLERLAEYLEARHGIQQRLSVALIYPIFLTVVSIMVVVGLVTFVVPKVVRVFEDTGQELPVLTKGLISISDFLVNNGLYILIVLTIVGFIAALIFRQENPRFWLHQQYLQLPLMNRLVRSSNTARLARTLSIMVGSGVPLLTAMRATEGVVSNDVIRAGLKQAAIDVAEGVSISRALDRGGNLPPLLIQMVASGEASGRLDHMLEKAAIATESELESRIGMIVGLFEPIMILVMGFVVLIIVMAILLPIFDLNQLIS